MSKSSNSALATLAAARVGRVSCLGDDEDSAWRSVDGFYKGVLGNSRGPTVTRSGRVWGKVSPKAPLSRLPKKGDGIAFYHSTRAVKPKNDRYRRKPRISLVATLGEVRLEGREVTDITFTFSRHLAQALRETPLSGTKTPGKSSNAAKSNPEFLPPFILRTGKPGPRSSNWSDSALTLAGGVEPLRRAMTYPHSTPVSCCTLLIRTLLNSPVTWTHLNKPGNSWRASARDSSHKTFARTMGRAAASLSAVLKTDSFWSAPTLRAGPMPRDCEEKPLMDCAFA
jgi:hypothetical protein